MKALILLAAFLMGCAVAIGDNSRAFTNTGTELKRETDIDTVPDVQPLKKEKSQ